MSARHPYSADEGIAERIVTFHGNPEEQLERFLALGLPVRLHEPEINSKTISFSVTATRRDVAHPRGERPWETYWDDRSPEWMARREETIAGLKAATTREEWIAAIAVYDAHHGTVISRQWEYRREDEDKQIWRKVKCSGEASDIVLDVAAENNFGCERVTHPKWDYCFVRILATKADFRSAQFDWLQRMIAYRPTILKPEPIDLFA